jgi:alanyl-tRNA synthetase
MALFGEKYGDEVRVLTMGRWLFRGAVRRHPRFPHRRHRRVPHRQPRAGVAAGVRRIEAVTGPGALAGSMPPIASSTIRGALVRPVAAM